MGLCRYMSLRLQIYIFISNWVWKKWKSLSHVQLFVTPWTVACQDPLSMEYFRPENQSGFSPFSKGSSQFRDWTQASCFAGGFFTIWAPREVLDLELLKVCSLPLWIWLMTIMGFPGGAVVKESACQCRRCRFNPWVKKIPWSRKWQPTSLFLPGKSHGEATVHGVAKESNMIDRLTTHTGCHTVQLSRRNHQACWLAGQNRSS